MMTTQLRLVMTLGLSALVLFAGCEPEPKNIGNDDGADSGDGDGDGDGDGGLPGDCTPGDVVDHPDGCNTCTCDDLGDWACTEIACEYQPCADLECGDICDPCPEWDDDCVAPGAITYCDPQGDCRADWDPLECPVGDGDGDGDGDGEDALCEATGGYWDELACGHYDCSGLPNECEAVIPGCNCGAGSIFMEGEGCIAVPCGAPPDPQLHCEATEGTWDVNTCGHYICGEPSMDDCVQPGCDCGSERNFVEGYGCLPDPECG